MKVARRTADVFISSQEAQKRNPVQHFFTRRLGQFGVGHREYRMSTDRDSLVLTTYVERLVQRNHSAQLKETLPTRPSGLEVPSSHSPKGELWVQPPGESMPIGRMVSTNLCGCLVVLLFSCLNMGWRSNPSTAC